MARPLVLDAIFESVTRTGNLLVVDTGWKTLGLGSEIVSQVVECCFGSLRKPPRRLGLPDHPTPSSISLASTYYPRAEQIGALVCDLTETDAAARQQILEELSTDRRTHPIDVPHPTFQGPF